MRRKHLRKIRARRSPAANVALNALPGTASRVPATVAKNKFATLLEDVMQGREVIITKHNSPKAVVMSVERFNALAKASSPDLTALSADFDARLARMQTPKTRSALQAAFDASPDELGRAALKQPRSR
ncbi:MAG: type II toxin-antitoxin system prevent-host-death family antitoxin [Acidobacteriia bacterium]|nr:type II toxin-antitoxin system prevent-host-death family antitoxin [Terriglobia bacterium]